MSELTALLPGICTGEFDDELDHAIEVLTSRRQAVRELDRLERQAARALIPDPNAEVKAGEGVWWNAIASNEIEVFGVRYKITDAPGQRATLQCVVNGEPIYMMTKTPPWWLAGYIRGLLAKP